MQIKKTLTPEFYVLNAYSCLGSRYYNPRESVWLSVDPLALFDPIQNEEHYIDGEHNGGVYNNGNLNPYLYCYQNPVIYVDPNGKQFFVTEIPFISSTELMLKPTIEMSLPRMALPRVALPRIEPLDIDPLLPPPAIKLDFGKIAQSDKIEYANDLERAQDKLDGIQKAQNNNKKNAPKGDKQHKIEGLKKSEQNYDYNLKRIDLKDLDNISFEATINPPQQKKDQIQINTNKPTPIEQKVLNKKEQERIFWEKVKKGQISVS